MKYLFTILIFCIISISTYGQTFSIVSWNISHFGKTKDASEIKRIAQIVRDFDIIAIQEVVAIDPAGAKAVARLADELNRMGAKWDYRVSNPTNSSSGKTERYAFIWKSKKVFAFMGKSRNVAPSGISKFEFDKIWKVSRFV